MLATMCYFLQVALTCEDSTALYNGSQGQAFLSTVIDSPPYQSTNSSSVLGTSAQSCPSRHHHTAVYDPCSNSLWIYGGLDHSEKPCEGLAVVNLSQALSSSVNSTKVLEEEAARWVVDSGGEDPHERFLHTAVLLPVSP